MKHAIPNGNFYYYSSPIGPVFMATTDQGICNLSFDDTRLITNDAVSKESLHPFLQQLITELDTYFTGNLKSFTVPLDPQGTDFQKKVWAALVAVPYGETVSYAQLSNNLQQPDAIRAVANANARNPLLIIVPCHRIIGTNGNLTGYAAGLPRKKFLLELEGAIQPTRQLSLEL